MKAFLLTIAGVASIGCLAVCFGFSINRSYSMPYGIYRTTDATYSVGDLVIACPPLAPDQKVYLGPGRCPSGMEPVLKPVVAAAGDVVQVSAAGVAVNGRLLPDTAPMPRDGAGRPLRAFQAGTYAVGPGQVWLVVQLHDSFDSRYLGSVAVSDILSRVEPVLTWR